MASVEISDLRAKDLRIPFRTAFRHASAERSETSSLWVEAVATDGTVGYGESCPRPYVTGETLETARAFVAASTASLCARVGDLASLQVWMALHSADIDAHPAAWCALELAILDLLGKRRGMAVERLLSLPPLTGAFRYSAVLGDADPASFRATFDQYRRLGFRDFKVKLSGDLPRDRAKLEVLRGSDVPPQSVRADANNLWDDAPSAIRFVRELAYAFGGIEEPIRPNRYDDLASIADALGCRIILDESFVRAEQLALLPDSAQGGMSRWLINLRVSKMGGLLRSLHVVGAARATGVGVVVGAQVGETSLLTRAALTVAHAAGKGLVAQEGAFGTFLLTADVAEPSLMFGAGGMLDTAKFPALSQPGLGFENIAV